MDDQQQWTREKQYEIFYTSVLRMPELTDAAKHVSMAWYRLQDTRHESDNRYDGWWKVQSWELEEATGRSRSTVRDGISQLVKYQIIQKKVINATRNRAGEMWLTRISLASLEQAEMSGELPQPTVRPIARCPHCGDVHVVDTMTRTCKGCGTTQVLYQTDHALAYDHVRQFCKDCLVRKHHCQIPIGQMMKLYKAWYWRLEACEMKKPLKSEPLKRIFTELGIQYKVVHGYRRYEEAGISPVGQALLEDTEK